MAAGQRGRVQEVRVCAPGALAASPGVAEAGRWPSASSRSSSAQQTTRSWALFSEYSEQKVHSQGFPIRTSPLLLSSHLSAVPTSRRP